MSSRRQYGEGSIFGYTAYSGERKYRIQWFEASDPDDGDSPAVRRSQAGFDTKKQAAAELRRKLTAVDAGQTTGPRRGGPTLKGFINEWLAGHRVAASTKSSYARLARLHVVPYIGDIELSKVTASRLAALYRKLESEGRKTKWGPSGLGPNTVRKVHQMLSVALDSAVAERLIGLNPTRLPTAKPPTTKEVKAAKPEVEVWTREELLSFLDWARESDPHFHPLWMFLAHTGVRRGEAIGLRWGDLDLPRAARIRRSVGTIKNLGETTYHETKGTKSTRPRLVNLDPVTASVLRELRQRLATIDLNLVRVGEPVFTLASGKPLRPDYFTWILGESIKKRNRHVAGPELPHLTPHGLRHTHATHLLQVNTPPKVVQERLGHETITITMDLYTHLLPSTQEESIERYWAYMYRNQGPASEGTG